MNKKLMEERNENRLYLIIWAAAFVIGALSQLFGSVSRQEETLIFHDVLQTWVGMLPFLVLFLLHNYLISPILFRHGKIGAYIAADVAILLVFTIFYQFSGPGPDPSFFPPGPGAGGPDAGGPPPGLPPGEHPRGPRPMNPEVFKLLLGAMMLAANLGIKYLFQAERNAARVRELEKENLQHRLDALRYQINPHFFMNTLNNIHALVDLDPELAKESIVKLSRMMRHILYDSASPTIPLSQEIEFLNHYLSLMKLRYADSVEVSFELPEQTEGAQVPPLVYASFVENAFKHGVSYKEPSFIRISMKLDDDKIIFNCANSQQAPLLQEEGFGIGMENVRHRLDLLYGDNYELHIRQPAGVYELQLVLPFKPETHLSV